MQSRLLCNLFDGMVAIEGGKKSANGDLYNDMPDRFADALFIIPVGYVAGGFGIEPVSYTHLCRTGLDGCHG